jgi:type IV secretory pathway TraG/TraD family ATPase VirD4
MDAGQVRALPKGTALLIATGHRPAMLRLSPWYDGPFAAEIAQADRDLTSRIATAAAHAGPAAGVPAGGAR